MCGIAGIFGNDWCPDDLARMVDVQRHRGPDGDGVYLDLERGAGLGHNRLSILDLSRAGNQPMRSHDRRHFIALNGEIYNYLELRRELRSEFTFTTQTDTEVLLAAYQKWGTDCVDHLIGMFAFAIWDAEKKMAFVARDRFGVKPLYYHRKGDGTLLISSEIRGIHAAGVTREPNNRAWATYLTYGLYDHSDETFWNNIFSLPAGHCLTWKQGQTQIRKWYDLAERVGGDYDLRPEETVREEYLALMKESVMLRFRSDVSVGINLSGGLDSSALLGLVHAVQGRDSAVKAFTFTTGDPAYDEVPWVRQMLARTNHPLVIAQLTAEEVPSLAQSVQHYQDEPFAGLPTLAYAKVFEAAKEHGVTVLLDGNGMDEQWAGYDYYRTSTNGRIPSLIQGVSDSPVQPNCLTPEFRALAEAIEFPKVFPDRLRNTQYRDAVHTKIPRAMRFNDRISMRSSRELREPFLDHRMFELAMRQPPQRKISQDSGKKMLREIVNGFIPSSLSSAPKRPIQTPQREWLRGPLREWAKERVESALAGPHSSFFEKTAARASFARFVDGESDNSFYIWQWISAGIVNEEKRSASKAGQG